MWVNSKGLSLHEVSKRRIEMGKKLQGKTALITGASGGMGTATAQLFAREGADLCLIDIREKELSDLVHQCKAQGIKAFAVAGDLTDKMEVERMAKECLSAFGNIDILINAAGYGKYGPFPEIPIEEWDRMWAINVRGMVLVMQALVPSMIASKSGHIVNIASQHGLRTSANASAYCATKFAVTGLTDALSIELWKYGIKVSLVCPGGVLTSFMGVPPEQKPQTFLEAEELAEVLLDIVTAPGKAFIKQVFLVPKDRPFTVLEV